MKQHNVIKFYTDKRARVWDSNPQSRASHLVFYSSTNISGLGNTPLFSFIVDSSVSIITAYIFNERDVWEMDLDDPFIVDKTTYKQVYTTTEDHIFSDGYYYVLLNIDGVLYYSDMFAFTSDVSKLLKIEVASSNIAVGNSIQEISNFTNTFYLKAGYFGIEPEIEEQGDPIDGVIIVNAGTDTYPHEFEISANENMYKYLHSLRLLGCNGTISITWGYETFTASDILVEKIENHNNGTYQLKLIFVDEDESVQTFNSLN